MRLSAVALVLEFRPSSLSIRLNNLFAGSFLHQVAENQVVPVRLGSSVAYKTLVGKLELVAD